MKGIKYQVFVNRCAVVEGEGEINPNESKEPRERDSVRLRYGCQTSNLQI